MKLNFTTLFYANYAAKGVALYRSLERVCTDFHMYIFAMDKECEQILQTIDTPFATIIPLTDLEAFYPDLITVKSNRNKGEYSWTCKGPSLLYCFEKFGIADCTYLDADLYFFNNPMPLYLEAPNADVMLMEHGYTPTYNLAETNGKYCAGYMYFKSTKNGLDVLKSWTAQCIEWCFGRHEPGRFGDQKYLDQFHAKWNHIHDLQHIGLCAPWNIQQYEVCQSDQGRVHVMKNNQDAELIIYHFHFLKNQDFGTYNELFLGPYILSKSTMEYIYKPYINQLKQFTKHIDSLNVRVDVLASNVCQMSKAEYAWHWCKNIWKKNKLQWKRI